MKTDCEADEQAIIKELFVDDVYDASSTFSVGDRWLDVGCHNGWFTRLAQAYGASVVGAADMNPDALATYHTSFPDIAVFEGEIVHPSEIEEIYETLFPNRHPNAIKIDIQGAEIGLLRNCFVHIALYDKLLIEWHDVSEPGLMVETIGRYHDIQWMKRAVDACMQTDTFILYATRRGS